MSKALSFTVKEHEQMDNLIDRHKLTDEWTNIAEEAKENIIHCIDDRKEKHL